MIEFKRLVVVGGGVAGLTAALDCAKVGMRVTVIERSEQLGGAVASESVAGVVVDTGAESYATRGGSVRALVEELGLADDVVLPAKEGAWLRLPDGRSVRMPKSALLGIPSNPLADDVRAAIGWRGAIRAYLDRIKPVLTIGHVHNLGELVEKRMGAAVLNTLVAPVTRGVYSADPDALDVSIAAPGLNRALTVSGSLSGAVGLLKADAPAGSAVEGLRGGMSTLVAALESALREHGAEFLLGAEVTAIEVPDDAESARWRVRLSVDPASEAGAAVDTAAGASGTASDSTGADPDPERSIDADYLLIATPETAALALLAPHSEIIAAESPVESPAVELVTVVVDAPVLDARPRGSGVLVADPAPRNRTAVAAKALTHSSAKWSWLADELRVGHPHRHVVRLSYGRQGTVGASIALDDDAMREQARADAAAILGVELPPEAVVGFTRTLWSGSLTGAVIGQRARAERLRAAVEEIDDLAVTGAWLAGTGLASVVPDAHAAAARIRHLVASGYLESGVIDDLHTRNGINPTTSDENGE